jgi:hypothetical protein
VASERALEGAQHHRGNAGCNNATDKQLLASGEVWATSARPRRRRRGRDADREPDDRYDEQNYDQQYLHEALRERRLARRQRCCGGNGW